MNDDILRIAASVLEITLEDAQKNCKEIPSLHAFYCWSNRRGGKAMIISQNNERLIASSAVKYEDHVKAFMSGRRN